MSLPFLLWGLVRDVLHLVLDSLFLWIVTLALVFLVLDDRAILGSAAQGLVKHSPIRVCLMFFHSWPRVRGFWKKTIEVKGACPLLSRLHDIHVVVFLLLRNSGKITTLHAGYR